MSGEVNLKRWTPHLRAAERAGQTLTQYASSRGLSRHTLYAARQMLGRAGNRTGGLQRTARQVAPKAARQTAFATVKLLPGVLVDATAAVERPQLRAYLPNGASVELMQIDPALLAVALHALAGR